MAQNIHSMNNKHVYLRNTECVGNDVKEVNDILSQIYTRIHQVMFVSPCREAKRN